jgi:hypothetical protein
MQATVSTVEQRPTVAMTDLETIRRQWLNEREQHINTTENELKQLVRFEFRHRSVMFLSSYYDL